MNRFTVDGSDALEIFLASTCDEIRDAVLAVLPPGKLELLLLGGGYGRGEGGVLVEGGRQSAYNDLEFYVFTRRYREPLHELAAQFSQKTGVDVEFQVTSLATLARSPVSMFYYDLLAGHRCLWGDERLLERCAHHRDAGKIPASEATRLMLNRCTGLLLAKQRLQQEAALSPEDKDFIARNIAKAQLALGDALLTVAGRYHWSCRERHQRLVDLRPAEAVVRHHAVGVEFKLHPQRSREDTGTLRVRHAEVSELAKTIWYELPSSSFGPAWRNCLLNMRTFGRPGWRHPRTRLLECLPGLLWEDALQPEFDVNEYTKFWRQLR